MTAEFARILALVDTYLANEEFGPLWRPIAGPDADTLKADALSRVEEPLWEELYEIVYMGTITRPLRQNVMMGSWARTSSGSASGVGANRHVRHSLPNEALLLAAGGGSGRLAALADHNRDRTPQQSARR